MNMNLSPILFALLFSAINLVCAEQNGADQAKPDEKQKRPNPFQILALMPKVIEKLRERFPKQNIDFLLPTLFKEIQETIQLPGLSGLEPQAVPGLIASVVEQLIQRFTSIGGSDYQQTAPPNPNYEQPSFETEPEKQKQQLEYRQQEPIVKLVDTLPDLAFDRDPSRHIPREFAEDKELDEQDDEDELGEKPTFIDREKLNLGEYDEKLKLNY